MSEQQKKTPIEDLLLVEDKPQGEAQRAQRKLIQFLIERGVYRWERPVDWNNQVIRDVCREFGWDKYAEPLTRGAGRPPKGSLSKTDALRELRDKGHHTAECVFANLIDPKHVPRPENFGAAVKEHDSGRLVEMLLQNGHELEDAIEQVAEALERLPVRVLTEWEKFRKKRDKRLL
jgi:hypothetical protein